MPALPLPRVLPFPSPALPLLSLHSHFKTAQRQFTTPFLSPRQFTIMAKLPSTSSSSFALDFLRRLLCAHTTTDTNAPRDAPPEEPEGRSPCIVARLMGLDAMPPPPAEAPASQPLLRRSRSASSVESPSGLGDAAAADKPAAKAAVVRQSASLREKPAYLRAENDMFLLLSFSPEAEDRERDAANKDERRHREDGPGGGGGGAGRKQRRPHRRKLQFGGDDECNSTPQSSSPVSVLEAHEDSSTTTTTTTSCSLDDVDTHSEDAHLFALEQQSSSSSSARRKPVHCTIQLDDDDVSPATTSAVVHAVSAGCRSDRERTGNSRRTRTAVANASTAPDVSGVWQPVCRLVEEDLKCTEWLPTRRRHGGACGLDVGGGGGVAEEVGSEILEQLVCEATDELMRLCSEAACASSLPTPLVPGNGSGSRKRSSGRATIAGY